MNTSTDACPICGEGQLTAYVAKTPFEYNGHSTYLDTHYSVCNACGSEQADAAQLRQNRRIATAFKKRADGLLTGAEIRVARERWGLTQSQAAQVFGGGVVAFSKYESDDVTQSEAMDKLLRLAMEERPVNVRGCLLDRAEIKVQSFQGEYPPNVVPFRPKQHKAKVSDTQDDDNFILRENYG